MGGASQIEPERFHPSLIEGLEEPVQRYFTHALAAGTPLARGVRLKMTGSIKIGLAMNFEAVWDGDARSFSWLADCGPGPLRPLRVHDQFADGVGSMDVRLRPGLKLIHAESDDVARSGAGRAALEAVWTPAGLLPGSGVTWRTESDEAIVATWSLPPERPEVRIEIDRAGAVRSSSGLRWRDAKHGYLSFGAETSDERSFDGVTIPSHLTAGWGFGTDAFEPFFECDVSSAGRVAMC